VHYRSEVIKAAQAGKDIPKLSHTYEYALQLGWMLEREGLDITDVKTMIEKLRAERKKE